MQTSQISQFYVYIFEESVANLYVLGKINTL